MSREWIEPNYFDGCGNEIQEGDLLKVYHFRHYRWRKKCYMYHVAVLQDWGEHGHWWAAKEYHKDGNKGHYNLRAVANEETRVIYGTMVIDSRNKMRELKQTKVPRPNPSLEPLNTFEENANKKPTNQT